MKPSERIEEIKNRMVTEGEEDRQKNPENWKGLKVNLDGCEIQAVVQYLNELHDEKEEEVEFEKIPTFPFKYGKPLPETISPQCSNLSCGCKVSACCGKDSMTSSGFSAVVCRNCLQTFTPAPCTVGEKKKRENRFFHCPKCSLKEYKYVDSVVGLKRCPFCKEDTMHSEKDWGSGCNKQEVPPSENTVEEDNWIEDLENSLNNIEFMHGVPVSVPVDKKEEIFKIIMACRSAVRSTAEKETKRKIRKNVGVLRQWLNELPTSFRPVSNKDIISWLELQD